VTVETRPAWLPLGSLLVREGLLTHEQLEEALIMQHGSGRRLGELLVEWGWVTTHGICAALAEQYELEFLDLGDVKIDLDVARLLDEASARTRMALPIRRLADGRTLVGIADPTDVGAADELRTLLGSPIRLAVVDLADLEQAIDAVFGTRRRA
jgi:MSHA biogenesis protein MshE